MSSSDVLCKEKQFKRTPKEFDDSLLREHKATIFSRKKNMGMSKLKIK